MSAHLFLVALVVLAYVGSILVGDRALRGFGLPSGLEYLLLGFVLGPHALAAVPRSTVDGFAPIVVVALGWLAFCIGLEWGRSGGQRASVGGSLLGVVFALVTGSTVAAAVWFAIGALGVATGSDRVIVAGGMGAVSADTTRHAARWVVDRYGSEGPLTKLVGEIADADDVVPLVALAGVLAYASSGDHGALLSAPRLFALTLGLGSVLGVITVALLGRELPHGQVWGVLLGTSLLAGGTAVRFDLPAPTVTFVMGLTVRLLSKRPDAVHALVAPTEKPVLLPALLLAGSMVDFGLGPRWLALIVVALATRVAVKALLGAGLAVGGPARGVGVLLGLGLTPAGALTIILGLSFAMRFPGTLGNAVLGVAAVSTVVGELVGAVSLRAALARIGEIAPGSIDLARSGRARAVVSAPTSRPEAS